MAINRQTSSIARPSKIYPNLYFWFENKPSGNPAANRRLCNGKGQVNLLGEKQNRLMRALINIHLLNQEYFGLGVASSSTQQVYFFLALETTTLQAFF
jgi:hypothetical protein